jgi:hypothetical protein
VSHISLVVTHCTHLYIQKYKKLLCTVNKYRQFSKQIWHWNPAHVLSNFYINIRRFTKHELKILCNIHVQWLWWHLCGIMHKIYTLSNSILQVTTAADQGTVLDYLLRSGTLGEASTSPPLISPNPTQRSYLSWGNILKPISSLIFLNTRV